MFGVLRVFLKPTSSRSTDGTSGKQFFGRDYRLRDCAELGKASHPVGLDLPDASHSGKHLVPRES